VTPPRWHFYLFAAATAMTWVLVTSGGVVCITDASQGCPDWPACHGRLVPPAQMDSILEWSHRVASPLTLPWIVVAAVIGWRRHRAVPWIGRSALGAIACILIVVVFGAIAVLAHLPRGWAAADLGTALLSLALMVVAATVLSTRFDDPAPSPHLSLRGGLTRLALASTASVFAVIVAGVLVARPGSVVRCLGWPTWTDLAAPVDVFDWLGLGRLALAGLATLLVALTALRAWRVPSTPLRINATAAAVLLIAATVAANLYPSPDEGVFVPMANMFFSGWLWMALVAVTVRASTADS